MIERRNWSILSWSFLSLFFIAVHWRRRRRVIIVLKSIVVIIIITMAIERGRRRRRMMTMMMMIMRLLRRVLLALRRRERRRGRELLEITWAVRVVFACEWRLRASASTASGYDCGCCGRCCWDVRQVPDSGRRCCACCCWGWVGWGVVEEMQRYWDETWCGCVRRRVYCFGSVYVVCSYCC